MILNVQETNDKMFDDKIKCFNIKLYTLKKSQDVLPVLLKQSS